MGQATNAGVGMKVALEVSNPGAIAAARERLAAFQEPRMTRVMKGTAAAGARTFVAPLRAAAPRGRNVPKSPARNLAGSIRVGFDRQGGRRGGIAYLAGPMGKKAFHRHWVTAGTRPHRIPKAGKGGGPIKLAFGVFTEVQHPGARANPFIARVGSQYASAAGAAMVRYVARQAERAGL